MITKKIEPAKMALTKSGFRFSRRTIAAGAATLAGAGLIGALGTEPAKALTFTLTPGQPVTPLPIAVPNFAGDPAYASQISQIVASDLKLSGYILPLDPASYLDKTVGASDAPKFNNWVTIGAQALVACTVQMQGGQISAAVRLWDVTTGQQLLGQQFATTPDNLRRLGHIIADACYSKLTGFKGFFDTRVAFVAESGPKTARIKKLALMDWDGANVRYLTQGGDLVLTPRFSPSTQQVAYMAYGQGDPHVFILNTANGSRQLVGEFASMTFSPRFSPDGSKLIFSVEHEGNSNIFVMDLGSRQIRQLTNDASINTGPSYSPDGSQIAFESDRGGAQQVYVMGADGSDPRRISFGSGRYATPVFSPDPDNPYIAFTKQDSDGKFKIGVMKPDGSAERIIADGYHNEGPSWAPNGRYVMYFTDGGGASGGPEIWFADVTGTVNTQIRTAGFASDPAWSPLLR
jgi:TolB protein